jgi:glucose uptake protein
MILPQTYLQCLLLLITGTLCLGSWAATYRAAGKWRFEFYCVDFSLGAVIAAIIYASTLGNLGFDGFALIDDLMHAGKRQWLFAFSGGVAFNLGNMFLVGAISIAGMAAAVLVGAGLGLLLGLGVAQLFRPGANPAAMGGSLFLALAAIVVMCMAYARVVAERRAAVPAQQTGKRPRRQPGPAKGLIVSLLSGLILSATYPLFGRSQGGEFGLGPYTAISLFAVGVVASTFLFSMFFMNLPLQGEPVEIIDYVRGGSKSHLLGLLGGIIWCTGMLAAFVALGASPELQPGRSLVYGLFQAAPVVGALWGILVFREFRGSGRGTVFALTAVVLSLGGLALAMLAFRS